jgi:hypothetical protein
MLINNHKYGSIAETMKLLKTCNKDIIMNWWEDLFMQHYKKEKLINDLQTIEPNPLFKLACIMTDYTEPNME